MKAIALGFGLLMVANLCLAGAVSTSQERVASPIVWAGCGISKKAYMAELAKHFEEATGVHIDLEGGGATRGIRGVAAGKIQMGGSCRMQMRDKNGKIHALESDASLHQVAWDAIVVVTHPTNPVSNLTMEQLKKIYAGQITSWKELGGPDQAIHIVERSGKDSGVGYMFRRYAYNDPDFDFPKSGTYVDESGPLEDIVEKTLFAIAVDGVSSARRSKLKILSLDNVEPSKANIASGQYYMFRPLFLTIDMVNPDQNTLRFLEFALSEEGQDIISKTGTVNLKEGEKLSPIWAVRKAKLGM